MSRTVQIAKKNKNKKAKPKRSKLEILAARRERLLKKQGWVRDLFVASTAALRTCEAEYLLQLQSAGPDPRECETSSGSSQQQLARDLHAGEE